MLGENGLRRDQINAVCVLDGGKEKGSAITLHVCVLCAERDRIAKRLGTTISGFVGDTANGARRRGDGKVSQRGRRKRQAQQWVRRRGCSGVLESAGSFLRRLGSGVVVDAACSGGGWLRLRVGVWM